MTQNSSPSVEYPPINITVNRTTPLQVFDISSDEDFEVNFESKSTWSYISTDVGSTPPPDTQFSDECTDPEALTPTKTKKPFRCNLIRGVASVSAILSMILLVLMTHWTARELRDLGYEGTFQPLKYLAGAVFGMIYTLLWMLLCYYAEGIDPTAELGSCGEQVASFLVNCTIVFIMSQVMWSSIF
ncbi:hypothetical protein ES702_03148 [subsurface metagenome]